MQIVRHLVAQRHLALLVCVAALLLRLVVPTGYMIDTDRGRIAITLCSGAGPVTSMMAMPGMHGDALGHGKSHGHGKAEMPCAFSSLLTGAPGPIDPIQLVALVADVLAVGLVGNRLPSPSAPPRLRPPLRGPPAFR